MRPALILAVAAIVAGSGAGASFLGARPFRDPSWRPLSSISPLLADATRVELGGPETRRAELARRVARLRCGGGWSRRLESLRLSTLSEDELLEGYLNLASYGAGITGVEAASEAYFGKRADQLTLSEALALSVMPDRPVRETLLGDNPADQLARRREARRLRGKLKGPASDKRPTTARRARS